MKVLLTTLNSKFVHSSLALRYLRSYCQDEFEIELAEYTINQHTDEIVAELYRKKADFIGFSCYIWNIEETLEIIKLLKKIKPDLKILLGGPEVSYDAVELMNKYQEIDYIICGEGEVTFKELLTTLAIGESLLEVEGLVFREAGQIIKNKPRRVIDDLDSIPFPYDDLSGLENKIIYYESSRGCPFNCQYCLSSTLSTVRNFSLSRVKEDLLKLIKAKVKQVKFVDRTFNCNRERTMEIFKFLIDNRPQDHQMNFHFEITANLLTEEMVEFLTGVPRGYFQFEIGVQSTHQPTLDLIKRKMDFKHLSKVVNGLSKAENIHLHLDLIAGLPAQDYQSFKRSFNDVYFLIPDRLQLGFLKLLKGTNLRKKAQKYDYIWTDKPPYEVLSSHRLSYDEMLKLKMIEEVLDTFGNAHHFDYSLQFIISNFYDTPFDFYEELASFWEERGYYRYSHNLESLYSYLQEFYRDYCEERLKLFNEVLKFDFLLRRRNVSLPDFLSKYEVEDYKDRFNNFVNNQDKIEKYLPDLIGHSRRKIKRRIQIETFAYDILDIINDFKLNKEQKMVTILFNYHSKEGLFNKAGFCKVTI